ncbi:hypothetical protein BC332_30852 [Capsicum chinense]|nr:hypothetical protein BC332_30852 [Capsicum chinense]
MEYDSLSICLGGEMVDTRDSKSHAKELGGIIPSPILTKKLKKAKKLKEASKTEEKEESEKERDIETASEMGLVHGDLDERGQVQDSLLLSAWSWSPSCHLKGEVAEASRKAKESSLKATMHPYS